MVNTSFEFFPPKTFLGFLKLLQVHKKLSVLRPRFVSVTGNCSSTKEQLDVVVSASKFFGVVVPHLILCGAPRMQFQLEPYVRTATEQLVIVRGDKTPSIRCAISGAVGVDVNWFGVAEMTDLVRRSWGNNLIADASSYPDGHPKGIDSNKAKNFLTKAGCGASSVIAQYSFSPDAFFREATKLYDFGVRTSIVPGLMCIRSWDQLTRMSELCGSDTPIWFIRKLRSMRTNSRLVGRFCAEVVMQLCETLVGCGVRDLHFYTLNDSQLVQETSRHINGTAIIPNNS